MQSLPLAPDSTYHSASPGLTVFEGRFRLERLLARGEGDAEWLAKDFQSRSWVTLRFLPASLGLDEAEISDLTHKIRDNWGLDHSSSINRDLEFLREGSLYALISEYREGFTLARERMTRPSRVFEPVDLEDWVREVCAVLDHVRAQGGPPHGDLKPSNLLQTKKGERILTRWGLASELSQRSGLAAEEAGLTGTLEYSSPQRLVGVPASFSDDFYALGASLYELITGLPPFYEGDIEERKLNETPPRMAERRHLMGQDGDAIPAGWEAAVAACLAKDAGDRPNSGKEFLAYLDDSHPRMAEAALAPAYATLKPKNPSAPAPSIEPPSDRRALLADETPPASADADAGYDRVGRIETQHGDQASDTVEPPPIAPVSEPLQETADEKPGREPERPAEGAPEQSFWDETQYEGVPASRKLLRLALLLLVVGFGAAYYFLERSPKQASRQPLSEAAEAEIHLNEKDAIERLEAERSEAVQREAERLKAEILEAGKLEAERLEAERLAAESREAERRETERLEVERLEAERLLQERESLASAESGSEAEASQTVATEPESPKAAPGTARLVAEKGSGQNRAAAKLSLRSVELDAEAPPVELEAENVLEADNLPAGRYRATASRQGWLTQIWEFELEAGAAVERSFNLSDASVQLTSDPEGAEVWAGDRKLGETPLLLEGLAPGPIQFELRRRFHRRATVSGEAVAGEKVDLSARLVAMEGPPGRVWEREVPGVGIPQAWIQPGTFVMGSPPGEEGRRDDESQRHVTLDKGFWIGLREVTQNEWEAVMGGNPSLFRSGDGRLPVDTVSWNDAQEFCRRLNEQARRAGRQIEGYEYRLPSEAEWEYASRAGTEGRFAGAELEAMAWYAGNSAHRSQSVGARKANAWGLFDMQGNLSEWCHDWYGPYPQEGEANPTGPASGDARVFRGGNWGSKADFCRPAKRGSARPDDRFHFLGLRVVLAPVL